MTEQAVVTVSGAPTESPEAAQDRVAGRILRNRLVRTVWIIIGMVGLLECIPLMTGDQPWPAVPAPLLLVAGGALALWAGRPSHPDDKAEKLATAAAASSLTGLLWFAIAVALWA